MSDDRDEHTRDDANRLLLAGAGIGAIGVTSAIVGAAVCPVCVVAAPALLGVGAYKRWRSRRGKETP
jgi:hypothetical protein